MGIKPRRKGNQPLPRRFPWPWLAVAGALALIVIGVMVWTLSSRRSEASPLSTGAPRLVVDRTIVDEGYVQFNVPVRTAFRLSNGGDQPLKILDEPRVELVQGC